MKQNKFNLNFKYTQLKVIRIAQVINNKVRILRRYERMELNIIKTTLTAACNKFGLYLCSSKIRIQCTQLLKVKPHRENIFWGNDNSCLMLSAIKKSTKTNKHTHTIILPYRMVFDRCGVVDVQPT